jgi:hypothetical protein
MRDKLEHTVNAIKELVSLFKTERTVYLIIISLSLLILIGTAILLLSKADSHEKSVEIIGLFLSSGGIVFSTGRLLKMWSDAMQLINKIIDGHDR